MKSEKKILIRLTMRIGLVFALSLSFLPTKATLSSISQQFENQVFLPLVQQSSLLPHSLYYIDDGQIYRIERNGITITQITFESDDIIDFDVSPLDGKIVYSVGNQLVLTDAYGMNREILTVSDTDFLFYPHWSPDGQTLAYGKNESIYFYSTEAGTSTLVLGNNGDGLKYRPGDFSPDGSNLIVSVSCPCKLGVYNIASETFSLFETTNPIHVPGCSPTFWSVDSTYIYVSEFIGAGGTCGIYSPGLWRFTTDGAGDPLLPLTDEGGSGILNRTAAPRQAMNGALLYLFSPPETGLDPGAPFSLVRSGSDGVSNRVVLRPEPFYITRVSLWTPDSSALVIVQSNGENPNIYQNMILVPVNSSLPVVTLLNDASALGMFLQWGP